MEHSRIDDATEKILRDSRLNTSSPDQTGSQTGSACIEKFPRWMSTEISNFLAASSDESPKKKRKHKKNLNIYDEFIQIGLKQLIDCNFQFSSLLVVLFLVSMIFRFVFFCGQRKRGGR